MYCTQCGSEGQGNFCINCGTPLKSLKEEHKGGHIDWSNEIRFKILLQMPEIRELIRNHVGQAKKRFGAQDFLELCDKALFPMAHHQTGKISLLEQTIFSKLPKTGKTRSQVFEKPPGTVLVSLLCSLARNGNYVRKVNQAQDTCLLEATIPSDLWSVKGDFFIKVQRHEGGTFVEAATSIKGQGFDWGKSKRRLDTLFNDINMLSNI